MPLYYYRVTETQTRSGYITVEKDSEVEAKVILDMWLDASDEMRKTYSAHTKSIRQADIPYVPWKQGDTVIELEAVSTP